MSARRIILWRHGRTEWNAGGRFQGQLDVPLDPVGRAQAEAAAPHVAALCPDAILASDLKRATETAEAVSDLTGLPVRLDERLREIFLGGWQGLTRDEAAVAFPDEYDAWMRGEQRLSCESSEHVAGRAVPAVLEPDVETLLVVTHGGTARAVAGRLLSLPVPLWSTLGPLGNCRWSELWQDRRGWRLAVHNTGPTPLGAEAAIADESAATAPDVEASTPAR